MPRAIQAKRHSLQVWEGGSKRSYPPAPVTGGAPILSLTPGATTMGISIAASPPAGRTVVAYEIRRLIGGTWTTLSLTEPSAPSEIPARSTVTATKRVHPSGTLDGFSAYTTFQAALSAAVGGDEIVVGGTSYSERLLMTVSGTATSPIRIRPHNYDSPPVVDGTGVTVSWNGSTGSASLVAIQANHVIWDGIPIRDSQGHGLQVGECANNGFFIANSAVWYSGIKVYRTPISECEGVGFVALMGDGYDVLGCDISACQKGTYWETAAGNPVGWAYAVLLTGRNAKFNENRVRHTIGEGISVGHHIQYLTSPSRAVVCKNFEIRRNELHDCWSQPIYYAACEDGVVDQNLIYMTNDPRFWYDRSTSTGYPQYGMAFGCELGAFGNPTQTFDTTYVGCRNMKVRNNIINGANRLFQFTSFVADGGVANYQNIDVDHNTIFCTKGAFPSIYEALRNSMNASTDEMTTVRVRNNIVAVSDASDISTTWNALGAGKVVKGNVFSHSPPSDLADASNIIDGGSTVLDDKTYSITGVNWPSLPTFNLSKAAPFRSSSVVSPAVNAVDAIGVTVDFYGRTRPLHTGKVDAGAISLSKPNDLTYSESGLANATAYQYDGRYQTDDGQWSAWSEVKTATTGAGGGGAVAPTFDQIAQISTNLQGTSSGAKNWSPDLTGVDAGDVVLVQAVHLSLDTPGAFNAMLAPTGYHLLGSDESDSGDWGKAWWWFHIWEAGDVDPTFTADNSQGSYRITGQAAVYKSNASGINKLDHTVASSGTSTGGSTTTLQNSGATWTPDQWANHLLYLPASGKYAMVSTNTETQLTLRTDIGLTIGSGLSYEIRALKFAKQRNSTASISVTAPGLTPTQQPCRLVSMYLGTDGNTNLGTETLTVPGSMSKRGEVKDNNNWTFAALADEVRSNLSATGTRVATFPSVAPESWGASIVIRGG